MKKKIFCGALWLAALLLCGFQAQNFPGVGLATSSGGTTNLIPKFTAASIIGNSSVTDNATTLSTTDTIFSVPAAGVHQFSSDTGISRDAAGIIDIGTGAAASTAGTLKAASIIPNASAITAGADGTVINVGEIRRVVYKITVSGTTCTSAGGFIAAALNADCVIATFPAKTEVVRIVVDNTAGFTCSATCTGTKTVQVGKTSGGSEYTVAKDATVVATYGLVNGDLGAALTTSATTPVGGGDIPSWTATTTIRARYVSGTGNWGTGAATTVNAGSTTFYIETLVFP